MSLPLSLSVLGRTVLLTVATIGLLRSNLAFAAGEDRPAVPTVTVHKAKTDASAPLEKKDGGRFLKMHESFLERGKAGPVGILFLGDSITEHWAKAPAVWEKYYGALHPANFGIGGDQTQNVIWRIEHGELDHISPRVVVLLIGTNNTATHTAPQITAAVTKIVGMVRTKLPESKVLLLAIFPRGPRKNPDGSMDDAVQRMAVIHDVNIELAALDDGHAVRYLDIGAKFLDPAGKIPVEIMPDHLHPSAAGYQIWADAMQPLLDRMLNEKGTK